MLVLSRFIGESIVIGDGDLTLTVLDVGTNGACLAIESSNITKRVYRFIDELLHVGDVQIMVVSIRDDRKIRIGIQAPRNITIHRQEIYEKIQGGAQ